MDNIRIPAEMKSLKDTAIKRFQLFHKENKELKSNRHLLDMLSGHFITGKSMSDTDIAKCTELMRKIQDQQEEMYQVHTDIIDYDALIVSTIEAYLLGINIKVPMAGGVNENGKSIPNRIAIINTSGNPEGMKEIGIDDVWAVRLIQKIFGRVNTANISVRDKSAEGAAQQGVL